MRFSQLLTAAIVLSTAVTASAAPRITGEYLESRTCDVYTGPCFANGEMDLAGKKAVMAWKVDRGEWNGVKLTGLGTALVVKAEGTLGYDGIFDMKAGKVEGVILVDEQASEAQEKALVEFVKDSAGELAETVVRVDRVPFELKNDHVTSVGVLKAGDLAEIRTRELREGDCVCTNEIVYYQPLTKVQNAHPAYTKNLSFQGEGLNSRWTRRDLRSTFLATFRK